METTEKIVEASVRHIKGWATIPNIRRDLLAIDPKSLARYSVSGSQGFAKLTATVFDPLLLKVRMKKPKMRRTLGYFTQHEFGTAAVGDRVKDLGFELGDRHAVASWGWTDEAKAAADAE